MPHIDIQRLEDLLLAHRTLLADADAWFARALALSGERVRCGQGCSGCCRSLFDVTVLDAFLLRGGLERLPAAARQEVREKAGAIEERLRRRWPDLAPPYFLNVLPGDEWTDVPEEDDTPCPLLSSEGSCLLYAERPLTCRIHGLPHVDFAGEIFDAEGCTLNFTGENPLSLVEIRGPFRELFAREAALIRDFSVALLGVPRGELDTFIPLALLLDLTVFDDFSLPVQGGK